MENSGLLENVHLTLNAVFKKAKDVHSIIENQMRIPNMLRYVDKNYIKLGNKYELQEYPIPVIIIDEVCDIGFNLDYVFIEKFFEKEDLESIDFQKIKENFYSFEVYGAKDCFLDFYEKDINNIVKSFDSSDEVKAGVCIYIPYDDFESKNVEEILRDAFFCFKII